MDPSRKIAQQYTAAPPVLPALPAAASSGNRAAAASSAALPADPVAVQAALPSSTVVPGDALGEASGVTVGAGVYALQGVMRASVVGTPRFTPAAAGSATAGVVTVTPARSATTAVPGVGSTVLAKVTRVTSNMVHVRILVVGSTAVGTVLESASTTGGFSGVIKRENCRETEVDKAVLPDMFVPGDIVRASVISLGTRRSYFLATVAVDTGVVYATSAAGHPLKPLAHDKMVCSVTGVREPRRVARDGF